ncbi:MAG: hypothetical protein ABI220_00840 [Candidatus Saccharimonadales bacterium]
MMFVAELLIAVGSFIAYCGLTDRLSSVISGSRHGAVSFAIFGFAIVLLGLSLISSVSAFSAVILFAMSVSLFFMSGVVIKMAEPPKIYRTQARDPRFWDDER